MGVGGRTPRRFLQSWGPQAQERRTTSGYSSSGWRDWAKPTKVIWWRRCGEGRGAPANERGRTRGRTLKSRKRKRDSFHHSCEVCGPFKANAIRIFLFIYFLLGIRNLTSMLSPDWTCWSKSSWSSILSKGILVQSVLTYWHVNFNFLKKNKHFCTLFTLLLVIEYFKKRNKERFTHSITSSFCPVCFPPLTPRLAPPCGKRQE